MNDLKVKESDLVAAVEPSATNGVESTVNTKLDFTFQAVEYQGKLRLISASSTVPTGLWMMVYQNGFPSNPNTQYVKEQQIKRHNQTFDTGLTWGSGYSCSIVLNSFDSAYQYEYVCQLTT